MRYLTTLYNNAGRGLSRAFVRQFAVVVAVLLLAAPVPSPAWQSHPARTTLLKNKEYGEALLQGIRSARSGILVSCYLFKVTDFPDNLPRRIAEELIAARRRVLPSP